MLDYTRITHSKQCCNYNLIVTPASDLPRRTIKCCFVVFGVTLKLLVINTSSSSGAAVCITLGGRSADETRCSQILVENRDFCLLSTTSLLGGGAVRILP